MGAIIKIDQIVLITRDTKNWRCPQVTMYKIEVVTSHENVDGHDALTDMHDK